MSRGNEKVGSLDENRGSSSISTPTNAKLGSIKSRPAENQPRADSSVSSEIESKLICGVREGIIKFKVEGVSAQSTSKFDQSNPLSSNQCDSLDKDDGYLSSSRQTSTRYSSSCTDDNRPTTVDISITPVNEGIQGKKTRNL